MLERDPNFKVPSESQPGKRSHGSVERYVIFREAESVAATVGFGALTVYAARHIPGVSTEVIFGSLTLVSGTVTGFWDRTRRRIKHPTPTKE